MKLNCVGETCPIPLIRTKKALAEMGENGELHVTVDNEEASENMEKMLKSLGHPYKTERDGKNHVIKITKGEGGIKEEKSVNGVVVVVSSDKMGEGDDELGKALLKTFVYTLTESDVLPKAVIFYNGGVKMTVEGSPALKDISALSETGVDILSCGACLNHYGLTSSLKVGRISNMYEIAEMMINASNTVKL